MAQKKPSFRSSQVRVPALVLGLALVGAAGCDEDDDPIVYADAAAGAGGGAAGVGGTAGGTAGAGGSGLITAGTGGSADGGAKDGGGAADGGGVGDGGAGDTAPVATPPSDTDIVVARFLSDGKIDPTFGTAGVARLDLGGQAGNVRDTVYGIAKDATDRIVVFAAAKGDGTRTDTDRVIARLAANGARDTAFGTTGVYRLNTGTLNENARNGLVQADGKIVSAGYLNRPTGVGTQSENFVQLVRLLDDGKADTTFGYEGVVTSNPFTPADPLKTPWGMAESYGVALLGTSYVTTGYGKAKPADKVDMVSFRYTTDGTLDPTWGVAGITKVDLAMDDDRGRNIIALPDGRVLIGGSAKPSATDVDAAAYILGANGAPDAAFGTNGLKRYSFDRPDEAFFGIAVSPDGKWAALSGHRAGAVGGVMEDADSTIALLPLAGGTEVSKAVEISTTGDDRFLAAAFSPDNKAYAAGFVVENGDSQMVIARFDAAGALDTTFGTGGVVKWNAVVAGLDEAVRGMVVQSDGKIVVAGHIEKK